MGAEITEPSISSLALQEHDEGRLVVSCAQGPWDATLIGALASWKP